MIGLTLKLLRLIGSIGARMVYDPYGDGSDATYDRHSKRYSKNEVPPPWCLWRCEFHVFR